MWLRPYKLIVVSAEGGLIEPIPNAISLHQVKRQYSGSLKEYFLKVHYRDRTRDGERFVSCSSVDVLCCEWFDCS